MSALAEVTIPSAPAAVTNLTTYAGLHFENQPVLVRGGLPIRSYSVFRGTTASSLSQVATTGQTMAMLSTQSALLSRSPCRPPS